MGTTVTVLSDWFDEGVQKGATHMIIVCDTFEYENSRVYVHPGQDVRKIEKKQRETGMNKIMEVYNLAMDKQAQFKERRAFNY